MQPAALDRLAPVPGMPLQPPAPIRDAAPVELDLAGMTCAACVRRVDRALRSVDGVRDADVNLATRRARVSVEGGASRRDELVRAVEKAGYEVVTASASSPGDPAARARAVERAEELEGRSIRRDALVAGLLTAPLLVLAMSHGALPGSDGELGRAAQMLLSTAVVLGPGRRFLRGAWKAIAARTADMNVLVSLGALSAWSYSAAAVLAPGLFRSSLPHAEHGAAPHVYFEASATIVAFVLLGKLLETRARRGLGDAVRALHRLTPEHATLLDASGERRVPSSELAPGDVVLVRPGERVPSDGVVVEGEAAVDESMLSGESVPVDKGPGGAVSGGTLVRSGAATVRITSTGSGTALARIVAAVETAQGSRAPIARLADRVSAVFVPVVLGLAAATFAAWIAIDSSADGIAVAIERMVAVLVIACPCALGLATPAAVAAGVGRGAELGILFKGGAALEAASRVDTVFLDKTGTVTLGELELSDVVAAEGRSETSLLELVAAAENGSEHPLARAIVEGARRRGARPLGASAFRSRAGAGVEALVDGARVRIGTSAWLAEAGIDARPLEERAGELASLGRTPSFVSVGEALAGLVAVADGPHPQARGAVAELRGLGIEVAMLTGDRQATAQAVAREIGIERVVAERSPEAKAREIAAAKAEGRRVAMAGDGVNDAPALATADVGIAMTNGADVAAAAADVALLRGGIESVPAALRLARATMRTIRRNLLWASIYNVLGIPVAAGALTAWTGWTLSPMLASAAMSLSSVSVLASSLVLRRFEPRRRAGLASRAD